VLVDGQLVMLFLLHGLCLQLASVALSQEPIGAMTVGGLIAGGGIAMMLPLRAYEYLDARDLENERKGARR